MRCLLFFFWKSVGYIFIMFDYIPFCITRWLFYLVMFYTANHWSQDLNFFCDCCSLGCVQVLSKCVTDLWRHQAWPFMAYLCNVQYIRMHQFVSYNETCLTLAFQLNWKLLKGRHLSYFQYALSARNRRWQRNWPSALNRTTTYWVLTKARHSFKYFT